jgi:hypothetical protein
MFAQGRVWLLALMMVWALSHACVFGEAGEPVAREPSPTEKIKKVLDLPMTLDYSAVSLADMVQHLREKTRLNWVVDHQALQQVGLAMGENQAVPLAATLKSDRNSKLRIAIQRTLNAFNLTFVILEDSVLITTDDVGLARQLRQRVNVSVANAPLSTALKDLGRGTALNLVIDPRVGKEADTRVTLHLDDASLETAVRLLAEIANLKSVRIGNVIFVTNEARAEKLRREEPPLMVPGVVPAAAY